MPDEGTQTIESPPVSVALDDVMGAKDDEGLNVFTDEHLESLKTWGSDDPTKAKFRTKDGELDVSKLTKSYLELQARLGKLAKPLGDKATETERFEYRKHLQQVLGVPDTPDGYELIPPKDLPDGTAINDESVNALKIAAHKHNMSREALQSMFDLHNAIMLRQATANQKAILDQNKEVEGLLKAEWGPDEFSRNDELLQRFLHDFTKTDEEFDDLFNSLQATRFEGGATVKQIIYKALCKAAELTHGEGQSIYADTEQRMNENAALQKRFPKSYKFLSS